MKKKLPDQYTNLICHEIKKYEDLQITEVKNVQVKIKFKREILSFFNAGYKDL